MIKRHEVQVLLRSGMSHRQVARQTGVSKRTVTRIAQEAPVEALQNGAEAERRGIGRPKQAGAFEDHVRQLLTDEPGLPTIEVLHRLKQQGYRGGKTAAYDLVRRLRGPSPAPVMVRFEGIAGEFAQFDFGRVQVRYLSGSTQKLRFARYRLKYSRWGWISSESPGLPGKTPRWEGRPSSSSSRISPAERREIHRRRYTVPGL